MADDRHTFSVHLDADMLYISPDPCPYDPADRDRPCWPHQENGEPEPHGNMCVNADWMGELQEGVFARGPVTLRSDIPYRAVWQAWDEPTFEALP